MISFLNKDFDALVLIFFTNQPVPIPLKPVLQGSKFWLLFFSGQCLWSRQRIARRLWLRRTLQRRNHSRGIGGMSLLSGIPAIFTGAPL